jgi:hypothetical protein
VNHQLIFRGMAGSEESSPDPGGNQARNLPQACRDTAWHASYAQFDAPPCNQIFTPGMSIRCVEWNAKFFESSKPHFRVFADVVMHAAQQRAGKNFRC